MLPAGGVLLFSWCVFFTCTLCQNVLAVVRLLQRNGPGLQALCGSNVESHFRNMLHQYRRAWQRKGRRTRRRVRRSKVVRFGVGGKVGEAAGHVVPVLRP